MTPSVPLTGLRTTLLRREHRLGDGRRLLLYGDGPAPPAGQHRTAGTPEGSLLHRRFDRLTGTWVGVAAARNARPHRAAGRCPLCPSGDEIGVPYELAVFDNRFPVLLHDAPAPPMAAPQDRPHLTPTSGRCEVVCYSPGHTGSLGTLPPGGVAAVLAVWRDRSQALWAAPGHRQVFLFENRGAAVGATMSHPHGQAYAFPDLPPVVDGRRVILASHRTRSGRCLSCEEVEREHAGSRVVVESEHFVVAVPFAARWPYEVHLRARRHGLRRLGDLDDEEAVDLARSLAAVLRRYDGLFGFELPYLLTIMEAPEGADDWHLSIELLPPHRSRERLKIRASVETAMGVFINDTVPEETAARLRSTVVEDPSWTGVTVPKVVVA